VLQFVCGWGLLIWLKYELINPDVGMFLVIALWIGWLCRVEYLFSRLMKPPTSGRLNIIFGVIVGGLSGFSILFYGGLWIGIIIGTISTIILRSSD